MHFDGTCGGLTEPPPPTPSRLSWRILLVSYLTQSPVRLSVGSALPRTELLIWYMYYFFPSLGLSRFSKKHGRRETSFSSSAVRIEPRQNESCHWHECRFAIVLLIRLQSSATEMHVREYKTFIVRPN